MFEQWGEGKADEILPGKHDTFLRAANRSWNFFCEIEMARSLEFFTRCRMENLKRRD